MINKVRVAQYRARRNLSKAILRLRQDLSIRGHALREAPMLRKAREQYEGLYRHETDPLVSVTIATYNRAQILVERAVASALNQTYQKIEVIVVGDGCTDNTAERLAEVDDPRLRFINLPERGKYPENPKHRWMVAGTYPINRAQSEAKGSWIAHLDDDAIWEQDHVEVMLREAFERNLELAYARGYVEFSAGQWKFIGQDESLTDPSFDWPHSSWFFRTYLRIFRVSHRTWQLRLAGDGHIKRRMFSVGIRIGFVDCIAYREPLRPGTTSNYSTAEDRI